MLWWDLSNIYKSLGSSLHYSLLEIIFVIRAVHHAFSCSHIVYVTLESVYFTIMCKETITNEWNDEVHRDEWGIMRSKVYTPLWMSTFPAWKCVSRKSIMNNGKVTPWEWEHEYFKELFQSAWYNVCTLLEFLLSKIKEKLC